ncbi:hypothetical protein AB0M46_32075 [Dactylosporangium sp. NPDC051485]|uniref:hypothetical protein n=1 Tax=Dactylosporangium sp. NPDC051485 TaxID=3154846 RepID=UPI003433D0BF
MPSPAQWTQFLSDALSRIGTELAPGLNNRELAAVEDAAGTTLPTELRLMLTLALPVGPSAWRNWRTDPAALLDTWREYVTEGLVVDARYSFWDDDQWGPRPATVAEREQLVRHKAAQLPRLFPMFGHRALVIDPLPGLDSADGNPVFSVHQTDVICYGNDLADWCHTEFGLTLPDWAARQPRRVPFWSALGDPGRWSAPPAWMQRLDPL